MKFLNVRLGPVDARLAAELRERGVQLSRIVREAIRAAHGQQVNPRATRRRPSAVVAAIYAEFPDPPGLARLCDDLRDRRSVRRAITARMRRTRG